MTIEDMLLELGHTVIGIASSLKTALSLAEEGTFDFATLDLSLCRKFSYPVADVFIRREIPFVFATSHPSTEIEEAYRRAPALQKPFEPSALQNAISTAFNSP